MTKPLKNVKNEKCTLYDLGKIISFWGRRPRTQETQSLNRPQEGLETYFTLTGCSLSAQMMPDDATGQAGHKEWKNTPAHTQTNYLSVRTPDMIARAAPYISPFPFI